MSDHADKLGCQQASISPQQPLKKPTHRRVWSIDQATSLASNTPELSRKGSHVAADADLIEIDSNLPAVPRLLTLLEVQSPMADSVKDSSPPPSARLSMSSRDDFCLTEEITPPVIVPKVIASRPGDFVQVGRRTYEMVRELGRGAFGIVWEAQEYMDGVDGGESTLVAVKCSVPNSQPAMEGAVFETHVLKQLT